MCNVYDWTLSQKHFALTDAHKNKKYEIKHKNTVNKTIKQTKKLRVTQMLLIIYI